VAILHDSWPAHPAAGCEPDQRGNDETTPKERELMPFIPLIAAVAAVLAVITALVNSYLIMSLVRPLLMLFGIAAAAFLNFTLAALVKKFWKKNEEIL
jgi:hypothetical protein